MSPATPCFPLPQRDTKHGADVPGRSSCSIAARSCCRVCSPTETRGIWGSPPAYLEIGSVLLHVLLHTQAELLNPLPLSLHSSAVGLGNTQRAVSDERFPAGGSEEGQRCHGRMDIDGQDLAAARIVWTQTQSRRRQNRNRHTPGLLQTQVCLLPASKPQAGCSVSPRSPLLHHHKNGKRGNPQELQLFPAAPRCWRGSGSAQAYQCRACLGTALHFSLCPWIKTALSWLCHHKMPPALSACEGPWGRAAAPCVPKAVPGWFPPSSPPARSPLRFAWRGGSPGTAARLCPAGTARCPASLPAPSSAPV